ncbi:hypothetical protein FOZ63_015781 [Perkinsus olseni]|uniref:Uncharacterized protein n=1 Tax=Perkinsus olseni TaxID=32597 RepID=A0A7J6TN95_PEROL|nr:hypothetical protein FOZ60_010826 [Perkinsus olseni]KAF4714512.1 hypothetical protein FOZ63_015781 [Perkinsus olseni]KAF4746743.1 hypothetical protein FOZ62_017690 [Perkinsus olseni]
MTLDVIYSEGDTCHSVRLEMRSMGASILSEERCRSRIQLNETPSVFGGGVLMVCFGLTCTLFDSRLRKISSDITLPGNPNCLRLIVDGHGCFNFVIRGQVEGQTRYRMLRAFLYLN